MGEITKIFLMGDHGRYDSSKKNAEGTNLEPDKSFAVNARGLVPYGFSFTFGEIKSDFDFGIFGYGHIDYAVEEKEGKLKTHQDYAKVNLERTIEGLENLVKEKGADYVLVNEMHSADMGTYWNITGKAQLLLRI